MNIIKNKTIAMVIGEERVNLNIEIEGSKVQQVQTYDYLGVHIDKKDKVQK